MSAGRRAPWGPVLLAALSGILAAATTLAVAQLVAVLVSPQAAPLIAVGGAFIDATPPALKDFAIATFGTNDKVASLIEVAACTIPTISPDTSTGIRIGAEASARIHSVCCAIPTK